MKPYIPFKLYTVWVWLNISWSVYNIFSDKRTTGFAKHEIVHFSLPELERRMQLMQFETFIGKLIEDVVAAEEFAEVDKEHED